MRGYFRLSSQSIGYDAGEIRPNFSDNFHGNAPDMGAHEDEGVDSMQFGVDASE